MHRIKRIKLELAVGLLLFLIIAVTRFFYFDASPDYFDAYEYLGRSDSASFLSAVSSGHPPYHPGYLALSYSFYQLFKVFKIGSLNLATALPALIGGVVFLLFFYLFLRELFGSLKVAFFAVLLAVFAPFIWLGSISILIDPLYWAGFMVGLWAWQRFIKGRGFLYALGGGAALAFALLSHTQVGFWLSPFIALAFIHTPLKRYGRLLKGTLLFVIPLIAATLIYIYLLRRTGFSSSVLDALRYLTLGNAGDRGAISIEEIFRTYSYHLSIAGALLGFLSLGYLLLKRFKVGLLFLLWLVPGAILTPSFNYANLHGRALTLGVLPLLAAISFFVFHWRPKKIRSLPFLLGALLLIQLAVFSVPYVKKIAFQKAAYDELGAERKKLEEPGLEISSNLARTFNSYHDMAVVWETPRVELERRAEKTVAQNKPLYIGLDAVTYPFFLYDGVFYEIDRVDPKFSERKTLLGGLLSRYSLALEQGSKTGYLTGHLRAYKQDPGLEFRIRKAVKALSSQNAVILGRVQTPDYKMPAVGVVFRDKKFFQNRQRLNKNDFLLTLFKKIKRKRDIQLWTFTDKDGYFASPYYSQADPLVSIETFVQPYKAGSKIKFTAPSAYNLDYAAERGVGVGSLLKEISGLRDVWFVKLEKREDNVWWTLYSGKIKPDFFSYIYPRSFYSHSDNLVWDSERDYLVRKSSAEELVMFGPWLNLPAGDYTLTIELKLNKGGRAAVAVEGGVGVSSAGKLTVKGEGVWRSYKIKLSFDSLFSAMEVKVYNESGADLEIGKVGLQNAVE